MFDSDAKNYHAWSHKIWLIERYELWNEAQHMAFAEEMLDRDVRNNSVWSFRYFIVMRGKPYSQELVEKECRYVLERRLADDWNNEAAWAYLRGFLAATKTEAEQSLTSNARRLFCGDLPWMRELLEKWGKLARTEEFDGNMVEEADGADHDEALSKANMRHAGLKGNRFLLATLADFAIANQEYEVALFHLSELKKIDPIRNKFYEWRKSQVTKLQE